MRAKRIKARDLENSNSATAMQISPLITGGGLHNVPRRSGFVQRHR